MSKSVAIIETNRGACDEFAACAERILPGVRAYQLIDDSILAQANAEGGITPATARRLYALCQQAESLGVDAILHTCVVAAGAVELVRPFLDVPLVRIDEAAARTAVEAGGGIAVFATAPTALEQSAALVEQLAADQKADVSVKRVLLPGTDEETVRSCMADAARECDTILLAQPSMAKLAAYGEGVDARILTVTESGFDLLRDVVESQ